MASRQLQQTLFQKIKEKLPSHLSLADELGELLGLSADSIYRRIRGEKPVTLDELKQICDHFRLSLDELLQTNSDSVLFQAPGIDTTTTSFTGYMQEMLEQFRYFNSFEKRELYYICKDVPFWYFYLFPELAAFKTFFWLKTIHNDPALAGKQFSIEAFPFTDCFVLGQDILREHALLTTVELWNQESIHSTINQIAWYRDAGLFRSREDLRAVVDSCIRMIDHLQAQTTSGKKLMPLVAGPKDLAAAGFKDPAAAESPTQPAGPAKTPSPAKPGKTTGPTNPETSGQLRFYINELILGSNTILLELDGSKMAMITYSVFGYLITRDERFTVRAFENFNSLLSRASLISESGEKERTRFFNSLREKVHTLKV